MNDFRFPPLLVLITVMSAAVLGTPAEAWSQPTLHAWSGIASTPDMSGSMSRGFSMSQPLKFGLSVDLDCAQMQAHSDQGVAASFANMNAVGAGLRYVPLSPETHAVRPWLGAGLAWQNETLRLNAQDAEGNTYHLWDDGLLYATEQPVPMPDIEYPSPLERDNSYETLANQTAGVVTPVRAGVDLQLTRRIHTSLSVTTIPNGERAWTTFQAGVGFQLGRGKQYIKTLFPEEFLALGVDVDGDGVKDHKDRCGETEPGAKVDKHGCAIDTDADGVPDHRDLEIHSPDMLVNDDGVSISLAEWKALYGPQAKDPSTFELDSVLIANDLSAADMAQLLSSSGNTADATEQEMLRNLRARVYNPELTYRVQYGAFLEAFAPSIDSYEHDNVEAIVGESGLTLHVGTGYETLAEARQALNLAQIASHDDAFLTAYQNGKRITMAEANALETVRTNDVNRAEEEFHVTRVRFHVQLGRFSAGVPVEVLNAFLAMGQVEQRQESDGTHRYLTAGVGAEETARQHLASAQTQGFADAFLVAEIDGKQVSVAEARAALTELDDALTAAK